MRIVEELVKEGRISTEAFSGDRQERRSNQFWKTLKQQKRRLKNSSRWSTGTEMAAYHFRIGDYSLKGKLFCISCATGVGELEKKWQPWRSLGGLHLQSLAWIPHWISFRKRSQLSWIASHSKGRSNYTLSQQTRVCVSFCKPRVRVLALLDEF